MTEQTAKADYYKVLPDNPQIGWICPVCGRGNSPLNMTCPCIVNDPPIISAVETWFGEKPMVWFMDSNGVWHSNEDD